jgi:hypothetical protein
MHRRASTDWAIEHQPATGPQQPRRFRNPPVWITPDRRTILTDHQISAAGTKRHPLGIGQRKHLHAEDRQHKTQYQTPPALPDC